ncbi:MAG: hypothetical protein IKM69_06325 [Alistipes sp.]|nr:hypothetical protein [Alistipes sp.]
MKMVDYSLERVLVTERVDNYDYLVLVIFYTQQSFYMPNTPNRGAYYRATDASTCLRATLHLLRYEREPLEGFF